MDKWKLDILTIIDRLGVICGVICLDIIVKNSCKFSRFGINSGLLCEVVNHCINTIIQYIYIIT